MVRIYIKQFQHELITVYYNGEHYTSSFTAEYGDTWSATISAGPEYAAGSLNNTSGAITDPVVIESTKSAAPTSVVVISI